MIRRMLCAVALALFVAAPAEARTNITVDTTLVAGGVTYLQFTVTTAGAFDIWTTSRQGAAGVTPFDPHMFLFAGAGTGGAVVLSNDDGCNAFVAQCGPAIAFSNSIFNNISLLLGTYTIAVGGSVLVEADARSGVNVGDSQAGDFSIRISSDAAFIGTLLPGTATVAAAAVPEPGSLLLLGTGIAALVAVRRRRR